VWENQLGVRNTDVGCEKLFRPNPIRYVKIVSKIEFLTRTYRRNREESRDNIYSLLGSSTLLRAPSPGSTLQYLASTVGLTYHAKSTSQPTPQRFGGLQK
jgi:hypothetical protein